MKPSDYEVEVREFDTRTRHLFFFLPLFFSPCFFSPWEVVSSLCMFLFERSEFLVSTSKKKKLAVCVCVDVRLILVLVWKNCLGFSVGYQRAPGWFKCEKLKATSQFMPLWRRGLNHQTMKSKFASSIPVLGTSSFFFPFFFPFFFLHGRWCPLYVCISFFICNTPPTCDHHLQLGLCWAITMHKSVPALA